MYSITLHKMQLHALKTFISLDCVLSKDTGDFFLVLVAVSIDVVIK